MTSYYKMRQDFVTNPRIVLEHLSLEAESLCNEHHDGNGDPTDLSILWDKVSSMLNDIKELFPE